MRRVAPRRASLRAVTAWQRCASAQVRPSRRVIRRSCCVVKALDAAQVFDFESRAAASFRASKALKVGIVGFGTFGQFLAKRILRHGHSVIAVSRGDYHRQASELGAEYFTDVDDFAEQHPDVVILASSILSTRAVLDGLPLQRFKRSTMFVDVLSVKVFPKRLLLDRLPPSMDILCTHPMFGPDSGKGAWAGLNFQYEKVRLAPGKERAKRMDAFLEIFRSEGCKMVEMSCEVHDQQAANTQFITHTVGRVLNEMNVSSTAINTRGYESLLNLVENTAHDSFDLYYGLFMYNQNSTETLDQLERAFDNIKRRLFSELHNIVRQQVFPADVQQQSTQLSLPAGAQGAPGDGGTADAREMQHVAEGAEEHGAQAGELAEHR